MKAMQTLQRAGYKSVRYLKHQSPTILSLISAAGVIVTVALAIEATPKALRLIDKAERDSAGDRKYTLTKVEVVKEVWVVYIPTILSGIGTIVCIVWSNTLSRRQRKTLTSAYILLDSAYKEYRSKVRELLGKDVDIQIRDAIAKGRYEASEFPPSEEEYLFYEENYGKFFSRTMAEVISAEYHFNRNFALRSYGNLNEFYEFLGLPKTELGETLGWIICDSYVWVDFEHRLVKMDDGLEAYIIDFPFLPEANYLDADYW